VTSPEAPEQLRDLAVTTSAPNTETGTASDAEKVPLTRRFPYWRPVYAVAAAGVRVTW
jgi:hypothetical protein